MKVDYDKRQVCFSASSLYIDTLNKLNKGKISLYDLTWKDVARGERKIATNFINRHGFSVCLIHKGSKILLLFNRATGLQLERRFILK